MMIKTEKLSDALYEVKANGKYIGDFIMDVDGYFYYWRDVSLFGASSAHILREIANALDGVNKDWDEHLKENL